MNCLPTYFRSRRKHHASPRTWFGVACAIILYFCAIADTRLSSAGAQELPQLRQVGQATQLFVEGKPFLALGGELGNSTASDLATLESALTRCRRMNLNTIMLPVYWDRIEPEEGEFDFSLVQGAIDLARQQQLRLVVLWFGTWKNSMSCYAPGWVKRDTERFERAKQSSGESLEIITPESEAANEADLRAFVEFMKWIRDYDAHEQTVVMVQVENEIGMIPEPRDHSELAERAYLSEVPGELMSLLTEGKLGPEVAEIWQQAGKKTSGSWPEVFGKEPEGQEIFTAWQFAEYVEKIAAAGKKEYPLPMFANAALIRPGYRPNRYPSGGPLPHLMEIWQAAAPSLDMICPDIYFPNFMEWCDRYVRSGNPLFIPEMAPSTRASANAVYAFAKFNAIGTGPFSIESVDQEKAHLITSSYGQLAGMAERILAAQQEGKILGLSPQIGFDWTDDKEPQRGELGGIIFEARFDRAAETGEVDLTTLPTFGPGRWETPLGVPLGSALIVELGPEEFVILGMGVTITFSPADGKGKIGIDQVQEGKFENGTWQGARWLGGDQTHQGRHVQLYGGNWTVQRVTLYRYE